MAGIDHSFVEWKEQFISQERGNRVVHYFLKDSSGESILAVVGTERSVRHMFYVVSEEFVKVYGDKNSIHAGFKWRSRREVVDWLTSMLSKQHMQGDQSNLPKGDTVQSVESFECPMNGVLTQQTRLADNMGRLPRKLNGHNSEIVWSGTPWMCSKQLKHYPAFCRNGTKIAIQSFVFVMAKGESQYIAYLEDIYADKRGQKKVRVRWFHHNQEVKGIIALRNPHPKEVFITPYAQVISAECVDGPATVLTREHYEKCLAAFPNSLLARVHMCSRQFRSNKVKPFDLSKLRGYFDQPIVSCLNSYPFSQPGFGCHGLDDDDNEEPNKGEHVKLGAKRTRSGRVSQKFATEYPAIKVPGRYSEEPPYKNLKYGKQLLSVKHVERFPVYGTAFGAGEKIELLCQDSGIRGCWFRCTILEISRKQIKVEYEDLQDEDGYGNLEEWVPASKLAVPDKLGMRYSGRPTIRPAPLDVQTNLALEIGSAVDAWWSDGWWEGVVTGIDNFDADNFQIYFPGESLFVNMHKKDFRISRDWVGDQWINIEAKPDILSVISAGISPESKASISSTLVKDIKSDDLIMSSVEIPVGKLSIVEVENVELVALGSSGSLQESMDLVSDVKVPALKDIDSGDGRGCEEPHSLKEGKDREKPQSLIEDNGNGKDSEKPPSLKEDNSDGISHTYIDLDKVNDVEDHHDGDDKDGNDDDKLETDTSSKQNCKAMEIMQVTSQ